MSSENFESVLLSAKNEFEQKKHQEVLRKARLSARHILMQDAINQGELNLVCEIVGLKSYVNDSMSVAFSAFGNEYTFQFSKQLNMATRYTEWDNDFNAFMPNITSNFPPNHKHTYIELKNADGESCTVHILRDDPLHSRYEFFMGISRLTTSVGTDDGLDDEDDEILDSRPLYRLTESAKELLDEGIEQPVVKLPETFRDVVMDTNFIVLDTETTGLDRSAEICQISIVDCTGNVLLDTYLKPKRPIPPVATGIHGITNEMVADAPTFPEIYEQLKRIITGKYVIVYNAVFDRKMLHQSAEAWGMPKTEWKDISTWWCAMDAFSPIYGDWSDYHGNYKWQKLETACAYYNITNHHSHSSLGDALATLLVSEFIACGATKQNHHESGSNE